MTGYKNLSKAMIHPVTYEILQWYGRYARDLPWRNTTDPYRIWLSEIMLQQTRVEQALPYYEKFVERFPDIQSLARADGDEVMQLWQGLGYYSRARNMLRCARVITGQYGGQFPRDFKLLKSLPGIGDYTAAAVASFAFGLPCPAIDGNVSRVISRVFCIEEPLQSRASKKQIKEAAALLMSEAPAAGFNQAMMEFGSQQCIPKNPHCHDCPVSPYCEALKKGKTSVVPVSGKKVKIKALWQFFLVIEQDESLLIEQRDQSSIWKGLYQFPMVEFSHRPTEQELHKAIVGRLKTGEYTIKATAPEIIHLLTHRKLHINFLEVTCRRSPVLQKLIPLNRHNRKQFGFPVVLARYIEKRIATEG